MDFRSELHRRYLVLDGSMGALLQNRGLPAGMAPDVWMMSNPEVIRKAHEEYVEAGADILLTNTFGSSRWRLAEYQAEKDLYEINARAVEIARKASRDRAFVAGNIGPSGETVFPTGSRPFEEVVEIFFEQARALVKLGVDLIAVETMFDSLEYRCALSAVREASSKIPVIANATFNTDAITDTGATPENIAAIAEGFHIDAVGVNCSTGPEHMVAVVDRMAKISPLFICVEPNAGLPVIKDGKTHFPMTTQDLEPYVEKFLMAGAHIVGGCCGTTPSYIKRVKEILNEKSHLRKVPPRPNRVLVSSLSASICLGGNHPFVPIGEKMNPSGRKKLSESLKRRDLSLLLADAELQVQAGATLLDLNVGVPLVDEPSLMREAVVAVQNKYPVPLMIDSSNTQALDFGASVYYGRPLLNSLNAEDEKLEEAIPVMKKHGAAIICMCTGIDVPVQATERVKNAQKIAKLLLEKHGFSEHDLVFDCLGLVVSAMHEGSKESLKCISLIKEYFPTAATTLGLSNVSFGLPNRSFVHNAFLACAVERGLDSAIMSVTDPMGKALAGAATMWGPKEGSINQFIENFSQKIEWGDLSNLPKSLTKADSPEGAKSLPTSEPSWVQKLGPLERDIFKSIVEGQKDATLRLTQEFAQSQPQRAMPLFLEVMTPAIRHLGDLFAARVKFIPHLIAAADAMKTGVAVLEPLLVREREKSGAGSSKGTIVFATVKGDIHDIGKNICILMLKNFGFRVIDLGRNVDSELILETAIREKAQLICLSALMTTTMMQMKVVIDAVRDRNLPFKVLIGGAVVTPDFAREIGADGYSTDVGTVVSEVERVLVILKESGVRV